MGLRNARLGFRQIEETHLMENIIYNELRSRGYTVYVGVVEKRGTDENGKEYKNQLEIDVAPYTRTVRTMQWEGEEIHSTLLKKQKRQTKAFRF